MYFPRHLCRLAAATRGRPLLLSLLLSLLLAGAALLSLLSASTAWNARAGAPEVPAAGSSFQLPHSPGDDTTREENSSTTLRRIALRRGAPASGEHSATALALAWITAQLQTLPATATRVAAATSGPCPLLPGRRVQRGQAPPQA
ncbi:hypothetical protein [Stenotrophomonas sp. YIM B06876]|uniref:hypothetical protein n=1 Tax=Stenotrophomonas sp. YIM B06876 TaxID=3060211 RepID=UPI002738614C|nr:hypothetical protein [Stenotrophomonas sp. YIM B06876]